jgi:KDO2-lipid IV(A) lauroyltransferase
MDAVPTRRPILITIRLCHGKPTHRAAPRRRGLLPPERPMLNLAFRLLALLPLRVLHALGAAAAWIAFGCSPALRARLRENLPPGLPERERLLRRCIAESGKQLLELAWVWSRPPAQIQARVQTANPEVLARILRQDRAVLMLTPHLGCFEVIAQSYMAGAAGRARPMLALYREPRKAALRPLFAGARARSGLQLAPADLHGVRLMLRALRERKVVGLLPDQVPSRGEGVWAPFFGRPAFTMTLPARLARAHEAIVVLVYAQRLERGAGFRIHWEPLGEALDGNAREDAARINRAMERLILRCPEQYLWSYNRYKTPPGAAAPDASAKASANASANSSASAPAGEQGGPTA